MKTKWKREKEERKENEEGKDKQQKVCVRDGDRDCDIRYVTAEFDSVLSKYFLSEKEVSAL